MPLDQVDVDKLPSGEQGDGAEMSFLDHLEALRWHLIRAIASVAVFAIVVFIFHDFIFEHVILAPKNPDFITYQLGCMISEAICTNFRPADFSLMSISLEEQFLTSLKVSFFMGVIVAFPYIFWEIWRFIKPGLYETERKAARGIVFICSMLFFTGVLFGYFIVSPFAVSFLSNYQIAEVGVEPRLSSYVSLMTMLTLPAGLIFELPIVVYFLTKVGLVTPEFMKQYRKHAFVIILVLAAVITPPDVITQLLIGFPLYVLYEASIVISRRVIKKQEEEEKKESLTKS